MVFASKLLQLKYLCYEGVWNCLDKNEILLVCLKLEVVDHYGTILFPVKEQRQ